MDLTFDWIDLLKIALAIFAGGLVGLEREYRDKAAGLRTNILICLGATLFTIFSIKIASISPNDEIIQNDTTRIVSYVVAGIGFLGAGAILRRDDRIVGLTTASTIWVVAALGIAIGSGYFTVAGMGVGAVLIVLLGLHSVERMLPGVRETRRYSVTCRPDVRDCSRLAEILTETGLTIVDRRQMKSDERLLCVWFASGRSEQHIAAMQALTEHELVESFEV